MVLCNNITDVDNYLYQDNIHLIEDECELCEGSGEVSDEECEHCSGEGSHSLEPYQYFICNLRPWEKENLESWGVRVGYSEELDVDVIAIYDFGTGWSHFSYSKEVEDDYLLAYNETEKRTTVY